MTRSFRSAHVLTLIAFAVSLVRADQRADPRNEFARLSASVTSGASMDLLRQLTDDIGARVVGSPAYERAVEWAAYQIREQL